MSGPNFSEPPRPEEVFILIFFGECFFHQVLKHKTLSICNIIPQEATFYAACQEPSPFV